MYTSTRWDKEGYPIVLAGDFNIPREYDCRQLDIATSFPQSDRALIETLHPLRDVCASPPKATMSVIYEIKTLQEVSTTHEMCARCNETYTERNGRGEIFNFQMGVDRFFVDERSFADSFVVDRAPSILKFPITAGRGVARQASDHWGVALEVAVGSACGPRSRQGK